MVDLGRAAVTRGLTDAELHPEPRLTRHAPPAPPPRVVAPERRDRLIHALHDRPVSMASITAVVAHEEVDPGVSVGEWSSTLVGLARSSSAGNAFLYRVDLDVPADEHAAYALTAFGWAKAAGITPAPRHSGPGSFSGVTYTDPSVPHGWESVPAAQHLAVALLMVSDERRATPRDLAAIDNRRTVGSWTLSCELLASPTVIGGGVLEPPLIERQDGSSLVSDPDAVYRLTAAGVEAVSRLDHAHRDRRRGRRPARSAA